MLRLMRAVLAVVFFVACAPQPPATSATAKTAPANVTVVDTPARADACRADIPDCEAACALRETNRTEFIEWYDRRCAAVILGKNPDKTIGQLPPDSREAVEASALPAPSASVGINTLPSSRQLPPTAFDPFAGRGNNPEPAECIAARSMRAHGKTREADVLAALCSAKGGSETKDNRDPDIGF